MAGVFGARQDGRKLDFLKLNYKQAVDKMTKEMLDQVQQSEMGREVLKGSDLNRHKYVADLAVAKISKNLQILSDLDKQ